MSAEARFPTRLFVAFTVVCALFLAFAWASQFGIVASTAACAALLAIVALAAPSLGILLVVFCTPIRSIFDLPQAGMQIVLASGLVAVTLRHLPLFVAFLRERRPRLLLVLAAFILVYVLRSVLELLQHPDANARAIAQEAVFYIAMLGVALAAHAHATDRGFTAALLTAAGSAILLTIAIDAVNTYFPALGTALDLLKGLPAARFSGLHVNPNATGKYLMMGTFLAAALLVAARSRAVASVAVLGLVATTLCFSATYSKSTLLASAGALGLWLAVVTGRRDWRPAGRILAVLAIVLISIGTWYLALSPHAERLALRNFLEFKNREPASLNPPAPPTTLARRLEEEMRIGRSYSMTVEQPPANAPANSEMYRNVPGRIVYSQRDCGWECTGQRDRLWGTGLDIVRAHWLIGIGPHRWIPEYQARLSFPFDSPHNVLLEMWGGYGIVGVALYLVLLAVLLRQLARSVTLPLSAPAFILVITTALYIVALLIVELVDPAMFMAMNPHAIWIWTFSAVAARQSERV
jgi:O-antigen ligase/polysaccharide polymerase Wzy-like membrane protein